MLRNNQIPERYLCSITLKVMIDPVMASDGHTYEREAIEQWLQTHDTSPKTNEKLEDKKLNSNHYVRSDILEFLDNHPELYDGNEIYLPKAWIAQLVIAIKRNQPQEVQNWLDKDRRLLISELEGDFTALHLACEFSSPELVETLLKILSQRNESITIMEGTVGFNPIHLNVLLKRALHSGNSVNCELLLKLGAKVEQPEFFTQNTLLHRMVTNGNQKLGSWLLEEKEVLESNNGENEKPFQAEKHKKAYQHQLPLISLRNPLIADELENAMNLPSQAEIQAYAREQGMPLRVSKLGQTHDHESQKSQKKTEKKVENERVPETVTVKQADSFSVNVLTKSLEASQIESDGFLAWQLQAEEYKRVYQVVASVSFLPSYQFKSVQGEAISFILKQTKGDGDCFFYAVGKAYFTREILVQKLLQNPIETVRRVFGYEIRQFLYLGDSIPYPNRRENQACQQLLTSGIKKLFLTLQKQEEELRLNVDKARSELGQKETHGKRLPELQALLREKNSALASEFEQAYKAVLSTDKTVYEYCCQTDVFKNYVELYLKEARGYIPFSRDFNGESHITTIDAINELFGLKIQVYLPLNSDGTQLKLANQLQTGEVIPIFHNGINHFSGLLKECLTPEGCSSAVQLSLPTPLRNEIHCLPRYLESLQETLSNSSCKPSFHNNDNKSPSSSAQAEPKKTLIFTTPSKGVITIGTIGGAIGGKMATNIFKNSINERNTKETLKLLIKILSSGYDDTSKIIKIRQCNHNDDKILGVSAQLLGVGVGIGIAGLIASLSYYLKPRSKKSDIESKKSEKNIRK